MMRELESILSWEVGNISYLFFTFLFAAAVWDFFLRRVPNILVLAFLICMLPFRLGEVPWICPIADGALVFLLFLPLWRRRMTGGGDVKVLAAAAAFLGLCLWIPAFLLSLFLAGFSGFFHLLFSGTIRVRFQYFSEYIKSGGLKTGLSYEGPERERAELPFLPYFFLGAVLACWWGGAR